MVQRRLASQTTSLCCQDASPSTIQYGVSSRESHEGEGSGQGTALVCAHSPCLPALCERLRAELLSQPARLPVGGRKTNLPSLYKKEIGLMPLLVVRVVVLSAPAPVPSSKSGSSGLKSADGAAEVNSASRSDSVFFDMVAPNACTTRSFPFTRKLG